MGVVFGSDPVSFIHCANRAAILRHLGNCLTTPVFPTIIHGQSHATPCEPTKPHQPVSRHLLQHAQFRTFSVCFCSASACFCSASAALCCCSWMACRCAASLLCRTRCLSASAAAAYSAAARSPSPSLVGAVPPLLPDPPPEPPPLPFPRGAYITLIKRFPRMASRDEMACSASKSALYSTTAACSACHQ